MLAYYVAEHIITDQEKFEEYRRKVLPMIEKYGGHYLTKGGTHRFPEQPHWKPDRAVIIEFPNMDSLDAWYNSAEYQPLMKLRKDATSVQDLIIILERFGLARNQVFCFQVVGVRAVELIMTAPLSQDLR